MVYDRDLAQRVRRALSDRTDVVEKRMVGGLSFMASGSMCCGVAGPALMVRVGREGRDEALLRPHVRPMELGGRALSGFVLVDPDGLPDDEALMAWIRQALSVALGLEPGRVGRASI
jgi:hypothetical protein